MMFRSAPLLLFSVLLALATVPGSAAQDRKARTQADLAAVNSRIEQIRQQVQRDAVEKDRLNKDLRAAEQSVSDARGALVKVQKERADRVANLLKLSKEKAQRESEREKTRENLAAQVRSAYLMGRHEPLKLLLNQRNPAEIGRNLAYYGYFGRLRAAQISAINQNIAEIEDLGAKITAEELLLAKLEGERTGQLAAMDTARKQRGQALASLERESRDRSTSLKRLEDQQARLERLLQELNRALAESSPVDPNDPFAKLRGTLAWPVSGKVTARFGETRAGTMRWNGLLIAADRGSPVRAVHAGRIVYADWLPGMGLLIIVDHGGGYLSLYGHNETLFRQTGAAVEAGDTIAAAGDSGGRTESGLYFEIRRAGKPVDPVPWFRTRAPPGG
jgi:septal ring factor EnvC (AmiA/AmiB activator)